MHDQSIWELIMTAGLVVKLVLVTLILASVLSWTFIIQRYLLFRNLNKQLQKFENSFWNSPSVEDYFKQARLESPKPSGILYIFFQGYEAFQSVIKRNMGVEQTIEYVQRAMNAAQNHEQTRLEQHLPFLASVGSVSPYVGLFGTVWGIMHAFGALSQVQQATIAMVAPGIAEALIATAIGLFTAIPAVIAYNRFSHLLNRNLAHYERFQDELISVFHHQIHDEK